MVCLKLQEGRVACLKHLRKKNKPIDGGFTHMNRNGNAFYMLLYEKMHNSYIIREMEIKITLWSHFFTYQIGKNPKDQKHILLARLWGSRPFLYSAGRNFISKTPMEGHWWYLSKLQIQICFDPVILLLGIYPTDILAQVQKDTPTRFLISALFVIVKD